MSSSHSRLSCFRTVVLLSYTGISMHVTYMLLTTHFKINLYIGDYVKGACSCHFHIFHYRKLLDLIMSREVIFLNLVFFSAIISLNQVLIR